MTPGEDFVQPSLETVQPDADALKPLVAADSVAVSDPADPLAQAVAESLKPVPVDLQPVAEQPACKYHLTYVLEGILIEENHFDIPHAVSRVHTLNRMGIFPNARSDA